MITFLNLGHLGQLGNQLFQFSALYSLSLHLKELLLIPTENIYMVAYKSKTYQSSLDLFNCFDLPESFLTERETLRVNYYYKQPSFLYDPDFWHIRNDTSIEGYFQSEKFFERYRQNLLALLKFKLPIQQIANKHLLELKLHGTELVGIHVRRRDYVNDQIDCKSDYYHRAIDYLRLAGKTNFVVVSDDLDWCREHFKDIENIHYMHDSGHYVDLCLLSLCDHNILCNSSFGWWGSWLNQNSNRIVVAPKLWCPKSAITGFQQNVTDVYCKHWTVLL